MSSEKRYIYSYDMEDFMVCVGKNTESEFDRQLRGRWDEKMRAQCFRYSLDELETRRVPGRYGFVAQLNVRRFAERRRPQFVSGVTMPFDPEKFHFGKVDEREIIFQLLPKHRESFDATQTDKASSDLLLINVSPIEHCSSLLVPSVEKCHPQILNLDGLLLAIETVLMSHSPALKVGMNGLGAFASVNHLHFHIYYLQETLHLQHAPVARLSGDCFEFSDFPSEGFAFQLLEKDAILSTARSVMKLVRHMQDEEIAHNIFITRGQSFEDPPDALGEEDTVFNAVRIFVWARASLLGSKKEATFNAALCELAGHLPIGDREYYESVAEDDVARVLRGACHEVHLKVRRDIEHLYSVEEINPL